MKEKIRLIAEALHNLGYRCIGRTDLSCLICSCNVTSNLEQTIIQTFELRPSSSLMTKILCQYSMLKGRMDGK